VAASDASLARQRLTRRRQLGLACFCLAVFALLAAQVLRHGPLLALDQDASNWIAMHRSAGLARAMVLVSELHETVKLLAATALLALWRGARRDWGAVRALLVVPAGMLLNVGVKHVFQRVRPGWADPAVQLATYSFPSGHAVASTLFYGTVCVLALEHIRSPWRRRIAAAVAAGMVLLVAFSRVVLGVHYPVDVVAGMALGGACLLVVLPPAKA
jgi:undecaprenyl-diphosphatase